MLFEKIFIKKMVKGLLKLSLHTGDSMLCTKETECLG